MVVEVRFPQIGINHMDFSDVRVLQPAVTPEARAARLLTLEATRSWLLEFIQDAFSGRAAPLLMGGDAKYRQAQVSLYD